MASLPGSRYIFDFHTFELVCNNAYVVGLIPRKGIRSMLTCAMVMRSQHLEEREREREPLRLSIALLVFVLCVRDRGKGWSRVV